VLRLRGYSGQAAATVILIVVTGPTLCLTCKGWLRTAAARIDYPRDGRVDPVADIVVRLHARRLTP